MQLISGLLHCRNNANYARHVAGVRQLSWKHEATMVEYTHPMDQDCFQMKTDIQESL